jgi:pyruvate/oxaloacetate carboxyltransferase
VLRDTPRDTRLDYKKLDEINLYLKGMREKYKEFTTKLLGVDIMWWSIRFPAVCIPTWNISCAK